MAGRVKMQCRICSRGLCIQFENFSETATSTASRKHFINGKFPWRRWQQRHLTIARLHWRCLRCLAVILSLLLFLFRCRGAVDSFVPLDIIPLRNKTESEKINMKKNAQTRKRWKSFAAHKARSEKTFRFCSPSFYAFHCSIQRINLKSKIIARACFK